jgi:SCP-2 sterol transfer family
MLAEETINELRKRFNRQAAGDICATYLFTVNGEGGGSWLTKIAKGSCEFILQTGIKGAKTDIGPETNIEPDCMISVESSDLELIMSGRLSAMTAALSGVLAIEGELGLAMQLVPIFFAGTDNIPERDAIPQAV